MSCNQKCNQGRDCDCADTPIVNIQPKDTSKGHFYVSLLKSFIRVVAGIALINGLMFNAGVMLIVAEVLGVVEELV